MSQEAAGDLAKMYARHQARQATENSARQAKAMQEAEASWLAEPSFTPGSPHNPDKSPAEVLYPNQGK